MKETHQSQTIRFVYVQNILQPLMQLGIVGTKVSET